MSAKKKPARSGSRGGRRRKQPVARPKRDTPKPATPGRAAKRPAVRAAAARRSEHAPEPSRSGRLPILVIDNYDSFTYNLVQYLGALGAEVEVHRNDAITVAQIEKLRPRGILISPGPGGPQDAGISVEVIRKLSGSVPILGVCLGHQAIGVAFGGRVVRADQVMHGKTSRIIHDGRGIFRGLDNPFVATRYHSLIVEREGLPDALEVTCSTADAVVMGLKVKGVETWGVQFHPESILTRQGRDLLRNFLDLCGI
jgi:anthranilate synthase/aminodeoxychorismate synthase-like glutamine amidotransferase